LLLYKQKGGGGGEWENMSFPAINFLFWGIRKWKEKNCSWLCHSNSVCCSGISVLHENEWFCFWKFFATFVLKFCFQDIQRIAKFLQ
jgi:hypothetical protein